MAKIAKPKGTKGQPAEEASQTLSQNGELIGLNFKIEPEFRVVSSFSLKFIPCVTDLSE